MNGTNPPPPIFVSASAVTSNQAGSKNYPGVSAATANALQAGKANLNFNLDEIFGDCFFTPDGETVFLSAEEQAYFVPSNEAQPATVASRLDPATNTFVPVPFAGGIATTHLDQPGAKASVMGPAADQQQKPDKAKKGTVVPPPSHHLGFVTTAGLLDLGKKRRQRPGERSMSDKQKVERRERNREHAKRSRIRKKFLLESLQQSVALLKGENDKLRNAITFHLGDEKAGVLLNSKNINDQGLIAPSFADANKILDDPDFSFIKAIQTAQQNFVVTDPSLPDNPIVYATQGFLMLTGYTLDQVLGRNCRFLQGPETDPKAVEKIRNAIEEGVDKSVCLLNYRADGTTFWNQFFIAALRDASGNITNYVGIQCKVSDQYAANICKAEEENEDEENENDNADDYSIGEGENHEDSTGGGSAFS